MLFGRGLLTIENEGAVHYGRVHIAAARGTVAEGFVTGAGSLLTITEALIVGDGGTGTLTLSHGGLVDATGASIELTSDIESTGTLNLGAAAGEPALPPGALQATTVDFGSGAGTLVFNHTGSSYEFSPALIGSGNIDVLAGTTVLTADSDLFTGTTHIVGGTLRVEEAFSGTVDVQPGGRLEGGAPSTVGATTNAGTVATRGATLNVGGDYTHTDSGTLEAEIAPEVHIVQLNTVGVADLQGGALSVLMAPGDYLPGSSFPIITAGEAISGSFGTVIQSDPSVPFELVQSGNVLSLVVPLATEIFSPLALTVDPEPVISDGNRVLEPGERVDVAPTWENGDSIARELTGTATNLTGPIGPTYTLVLDQADHGLVAPGEAASCLGTGMCYQVDIGPTGVPRPVPHWDASFDETLSDETVKPWTLHLGDSFTDTPRSHPFYRFVETLLHHGVSNGCGDRTFCPDVAPTRAAIAVLLLRAAEGPDFVPAPCKPGEETFIDVPAGHPFCPWIEELVARGITSGCGGDRYCPADPALRAPLAVLVLRTVAGPDFEPPACTPGQEVFADVPAANPFCPWIEELYTRGITSGCAAGIYCPTDTATRGQVSAFLSRAFGLELYEP